MTPSVLVVGAGSIGSRHVRNLVAAGADVSVTDPDAGRAKETGARVVDDPWDRAWDGVVVASPTTAHVAHARAAATLSQHVLVEKPLGTSVDEVNALLDDADVAAFAKAPVRIT